MSRALSKPIARSSMSRFLNQEIAQEATTELAESNLAQVKTIQEPITKNFSEASREVPPRAHPSLNKIISIHEKKRDIAFTNNNDKVINEITVALSNVTGSSVTPTHFIRALLYMVENSLPSIMNEINLLGPLKRPGNERRFYNQRMEYEKILAGVFERGIRKTR